MSSDLISLEARVSCAQIPAETPRLASGFSYFAHCEADVAWRPKNSDPQQSDQKPPTPQMAAIMHALTQARKHRHHRTCSCMQHDGYCSAEDQRWSQAVDAELDRLCG